MSHPNFYGETNNVSLPNGGITCSISSLYWQSSTPYDKRMWIAPQIGVDMSSSDYRNNVDRVLEAAFA